MVFITTRHLIATRRATSLQTPFLHMRMRAPPPPCAYHATHGDLGFYNDAARRVATVFEKWNCLIESCLPVERERPQKDWTHTGLLPQSPFWNTAV